MVNFGFSAFLKLISMNERPRRTAIQKRVGPSASGGYDFHKSLRRLARLHLIEGVSLPDLLATAAVITKPAERLSALAALEHLARWRTDHPGFIVTVAPAIFESPSRLFTVKFQADFGLKIGGRITAVHLWNTKFPRLAPGPTYAALLMATQAYEDQDGMPDDVAVLSIRQPTHLYRFSEVVAPRALTTAIVDQVEDMIRDSSPPPPPPPGAHPPPPR